MVSNEEMLGLRERMEVGVDGIDDAAERVKDPDARGCVGNGSLYRDGVTGRGELTTVSDECPFCVNGDTGRRRRELLRGKVLLCGDGDDVGDHTESESRLGSDNERGAKSVSESSAMLSISANGEPIGEG